MTRLTIPFKSKKQSKEEKTPMKTNTKHISLEVFNPKTPVSSKCFISVKYPNVS